MSVVNYFEYLHLDRRDRPSSSSAETEGLGVGVASKLVLEVTQVCCGEPRALQGSPEPLLWSPGVRMQLLHQPRFFLHARGNRLPGPQEESPLSLSFVSVLYPLAVP